MNEIEEQKDFWYPKTDYRIIQFSTLTTEEQLQAIQIGTIMRNVGIDEAKRIVTGKHDQERDNLSERYLKQIDKLTSQLNRSRDEKKEQKNEFEQWRHNYKRDIQKNVEAVYEEKVNSLQKELDKRKEKESKYIDEKLSICDDFYKQIRTTENKGQEKLDQQRVEYEKKLDEYRHKWETFDKRNENSSIKGQEGENWVFNELLRSFPSANIEDHHAKGHKGDFSINEEGIIGMVESKNYKRNVNKKEINKFYKDMETNHQINYGILLSLNAGVVSREDLSWEFVFGKPIIFVHEARKYPYKIKMAHRLCKLMLKNMNCFDIKKEEDQRRIKDKIKSIKARKIRKKTLLKNYTMGMEKEEDEDWEDFVELVQLINVRH
tara:strand:- start:6167 stop:7297 length:1131 start_codon:yes stop_codon:yes gene_type:complete